jgi:alpha-glucosidase
MMVDPAVGVRPGVSKAYDRGKALDVWIKNPNGTDHLGIVWPGVVVWPDWFNSKTAAYWANEFKLFFNPESGIDIDGVWIDMNEPASFCTYPCADPYAEAISQQVPPNRTTSPPAPDLPLPIDSAPNIKRDLERRTSNYSDILNPPYAIGNVNAHLSDKTAFTNVVHANGLVEYDVREYSSEQVFN